MLRHKAYKFRIYPNQEQERFIVKTIGCARVIYNYFLNLWHHEYATTGKGLSYHFLLRHAATNEAKSKDQLVKGSGQHCNSILSETPLHKITEVRKGIVFQRMMPSI